MPRYYFNYQYADEKVLADRVGTELSDLEAVEREDRVVALEILSDEVMDGASPTDPRCLEIENDRGEIVLYLPFWARVPLATERA